MPFDREKVGYQLTYFAPADSLENLRYIGYSRKCIVFTSTAFLFFAICVGLAFTMGRNPDLLEYLIYALGILGLICSIIGMVYGILTLDAPFRKTRLIGKWGIAFCAVPMALLLLLLVLGMLNTL